MQKICEQCSAPFEITPDDLKFLEKVSPEFGGKKELIPPPTLCPDCRQQRRLSWRNERNLYHRKCDLTGKQIISMYAPENAQNVYDQEVFWSDAWDPLAYGRDFDFQKSFFAQFADLFSATPRINLINKEHQNSEYCNFCMRNKNCYLLFTSGECEDSFYLNRSWTSRNCCDCSNLKDGELCYEIIDSDHCYHCQYLTNCANCSDCVIGYNLRGCRDCFACYNLQNAQFCIGNARYTKEKYLALVEELRKDIPAALKQFEKRTQSMPRKYMDCINAEGCTGNAIINAKNAVDCYEVIEMQDCKYVANATHMKDAMDVNNDDHSELVYEAVGSETNYMHCFNDICWFNKNLLYCSLCFHCEHCFGCSSLKHKKYCILNKQYTKEEYEKLMPKIIETMRKLGEWGEFFPTKFSPFGYNETMASDFFPLAQEKVASKGWKWNRSEDQEHYMGKKVTVPETIEETDDAICKEILRCSVTDKPYKIIPQELSLYRQMRIAPPKKCPEQRYKERMALHNPRRLWARNCAKCSAELQTTYSPDRPEVLYCESCYHSSIF